MRGTSAVSADPRPRRTHGRRRRSFGCVGRDRYGIEEGTEASNQESMRQASYLHLLLGVAALLLSLLVSPPSSACINATIGNDEAIVKLKEAERALEEGDVATARDLASEVRLLTSEYVVPNRHGIALNEHATRLDAIARVRDPAASAHDLGWAVELLEQHIKGIENRSEGEDRSISPALTADLGEAYERVGRDEDALRTLRPLADKDLMGSAYAYAALGRAAGRRGETARATAALQRCAVIASRPSQCRGEYPKPPLLRGGPLGYLIGGLVFLGGLLLRIVPRGRRPRAPWTNHAPKAFAPAALAGGLLTLYLAPHPWIAGLVAASVVYGLAAGQRAVFFRDVRRGKVPGFQLRAVEPVDLEALPLLRLAFGGIAAEGETLERLPLPAYRENARTPLLRLRRLRIPLWAVALLLLGAAFSGCFMLSLRAV
jgi:hypothetical protein